MVHILRVIMVDWQADTLETKRAWSDEGAVRYAVDLAKKNSEAVSFIPTPRLEQYAARGQLIIANENTEPCGFLVFGRGWPQLRIYQACIQYDARRQEHGLALVNRVDETAGRLGCSDIRLWCADDLEANAFWAAAGFKPVGRRVGGVRRGRRHTLWVRTLAEPALLAKML